MKLVSLLLATLIIPSTLGAEPSCTHRKKNLAISFVKCVWNLMKIGTGIASLCVGAHVCMLPLKTGHYAKVISWIIPKSHYANRIYNACGNCCIGFGILLASPFFYLSYRTIKSGIHGLHKLNKTKPCLYCEYDQNHATLNEEFETKLILFEDREHSSLHPQHS